MKVLFDENIDLRLAEMMSMRVTSTGIEVRHAYEPDLGFRGVENGDLMPAAVKAGFTHLVTHDKRMRNKYKAPLPVLVVDATGEDTLADMRLKANALADALMDDDPPSAPGYHPISAPTLKPSRKLRLFIEAMRRGTPINYEPGLKPMRSSRKNRDKGEDRGR